MNIGEAGLSLIKNFESMRHEAYQCPMGVWTIGYGHTSGVQPGEVITTEKAETLLRQDVKFAEQAIVQLVTVPLTQNEFDALASFVFNIGGNKFRTSTLLKKLNSGDYRSAADELLQWSHGGGKTLPGLMRRRIAEKTLYLQPE